MINVSVSYTKKSQKTNTGTKDLVFSSFEDLFFWLENVKGLPQNSLGVILYGLAKDGRNVLSTRTEIIEIKSDLRHYFLARETAIETGLLNVRGGGDSYVRTYQAGLVFARAVDSRFIVAQK